MLFRITSVDGTGNGKLLSRPIRTIHPEAFRAEPSGSNTKAGNAAANSFSGIWIVLQRRL